MAKTKSLNISVGEDAPFLEYSFDDLISWLEGRLLIAIGRGEFHSEIYQAVRFANDWHIYNAAKMEQK